MGHTHIWKTHIWRPVGADDVDRGVAKRLARDYDGDISAEAPEVYECSCNAAMVAIRSEAGDIVRAIRESPKAPWRKLPLRSSGIYTPGEAGQDLLWPEGGDLDFAAFGPKELDLTEPKVAHRHTWDTWDLPAAALAAVVKKLSEGLEGQVTTGTSRCKECGVTMVEAHDGQTLNRALTKRGYGPGPVWFRATGERDHEELGEPIFGRRYPDGAHVRVTTSETSIVGRVEDAHVEGTDWVYAVRPDNDDSGAALRRGGKRLFRESSLELYELDPEQLSIHDHAWELGADLGRAEHDDVVGRLEQYIDAGHSSWVYSCECGAVLIKVGEDQEGVKAIRPSGTEDWYRTVVDSAEATGSEGPGNLLFNPVERRFADGDSVENRARGWTGEVKGAVCHSGVWHYEVQAYEPRQKRLAYTLAAVEQDLQPHDAAGPPAQHNDCPMAPMDFRCWEVGEAKWMPAGVYHAEDYIRAELRPVGMDIGYALPDRGQHVIAADCQIVIEPDMSDDDPEDEPRDRFAVTPSTLAAALAVLTEAGGPDERGGYHLEPHRERLREALGELLRMTPDTIEQHLAHVKVPGPFDEIEAGKLMQESEWEDGVMPAAHLIWAQLRKTQPKITLWEVALALVLGGNMRPSRIQELEDTLEKASKARERDAQELAEVKERAEGIRDASVQNTLVANELQQIVEPLVECVRGLMQSDRDLVNEKAADAVDTWDKVIRAVDPTKE